MASAAAFRTLQLKQFHQLYLDKGKRADGRQFNEFRDVLLTSNTIETSDGSCLVKVGNTTCVAGIKAVLAEPDRDRLGQGFLEISVSIPPLCCSKFKENRAGTNDESLAASLRLTNLITESECFDLRSLVIEEDRKVWSLELQVICLDYDGNFGDACLIAALGALNCATVPEVVLKDDLSSLDVEFTGRTKKLVLTCYPISSSYAILGDKVLADPSYEEETLSNGHISITWDNKSGTLLSVDKDGGVGLTTEQFDELFSLSAKRSASIVPLYKSSK